MKLWGFFLLDVFKPKGATKKKRVAIFFVCVSLRAMRCPRAMGVSWQGPCLAAAAAAALLPREYSTSTRDERSCDAALAVPHSFLLSYDVFCCCFGHSRTTLPTKTEPELFVRRAGDPSYIHTSIVPGTEYGYKILRIGDSFWSWPLISPFFFTYLSASSKRTASLLPW